MHEDSNGEERPVESGVSGSGVDRTGAPTAGGADAAGAVGEGLGTLDAQAGAQEPGGRADQEFLSLERELTVFLRRARASQGEMAREVHPDLESAAYGLLVRLDECGRQRATELAAYIGVGKATMSRQLRALEDLGLVAREPDPADGRAWLVHLTEEGRSRVGRVREARRARYVRQLAHWDQREVAELARLLNQLNRGMEK